MFRGVPVFITVVVASLLTKINQNSLQEVSYENGKNNPAEAIGVGRFTRVLRSKWRRIRRGLVTAVVEAAVGDPQITEICSSSFATRTVFPFSLPTLVSSPWRLQA